MVRLPHPQLCEHAGIGIGLSCPCDAVYPQSHICMQSILKLHCMSQNLLRRIIVRALRLRFRVARGHHERYFVTDTAGPPRPRFDLPSTTPLRYLHPRLTVLLSVSVAETGMQEPRSLLASGKGFRLAKCGLHPSVAEPMAYSRCRFLQRTSADITGDTKTRRRCVDKR